MKNDKPAWSQDLQQQTRDAITNMEISSPDGRLHFKNLDKRTAYLRAEDLLRGKLFLVDKGSELMTEFKSAEELLAAGWAMD